MVRRQSSLFKPLIAERSQRLHIYLSMNRIIIHRNSPDSSGDGLLRFALSNELLAGLVFEGLGRCLRPVEGKGRPAGWSFGQTTYAVPEDWRLGSGADAPRGGAQRQSSSAQPSVTYYREDVPGSCEPAVGIRGGKSPDSWFVVSNGRFATRINIELLEGALSGVGADVVAVAADPELLGEREKVRVTTEGKVAGFRRVYCDWAEFAFTSADWPHHLFIRADLPSGLLAGGGLPQSFALLSEKCRCEGLRLRAIRVGGTVLDLETEEGLLSLCGEQLSHRRNDRQGAQDSSRISGNPRIVGPVLFGNNIRVGSDVVIVGPAVVSDHVEIEQGAIVHSSIIGPDIRVPKNQLVQNCVMKGSQDDWRHKTGRAGGRLKGGYSLQSLAQVPASPFRQWGRFSYARCLKRITDYVVATVVLILFAPLMPFVALAIRLTSPGPVFYKDKRQGLHGREFGCLKFRTMVTGAHAIQEKLRVISQVDGPQFKMADDPRINTVGWFLRETYIDEIPQFFNVLLGQMSVVGPRPSPESENTLCPFWRDARLSVRPGITGLWQILRTRKPMRDFQEWIHYDVEYVRSLSLKMDLWICWQTTKKLFNNFISQF